MAGMLISHQIRFIPVENNALLTKDIKMNIILQNRQFEKRWTKTGLLPSNWQVKLYWTSQKMNNKLQHIKNGNRTEQYKIIHWNLGSFQRPTSGQEWKTIAWTQIDPD